MEKTLEIKNSEQILEFLDASLHLYTRLSVHWSIDLLVCPPSICSQFVKTLENQRFLMKIIQE